jgi:protein TonB
MPRDLFGDIQQPQVRVTTRSRYTVPLSLAAHAALVLGLVAATILGPAVMPAPAAGDLILLAQMPVPEPPPVRISPDRVTRAPTVSRHAAPVVAPVSIRPETAATFDLSPTVSLVPGMITGASHFETVIGDPPAPPPPPARVRVGGEVRPPTKVLDVAPVYPAIAQAARVEGVVIIEATIDASGRVADARVLRGVPLLDAAAVGAVQQWRFTPTLLNGVPVSVVMTVTVRFELR